MLDLSLIVPVYNMAKDGNLEYCLNSLVGQTLENMEVIAVDDKSTDDSLKILYEFEAKYPGRFKAVASPENRRQGGARNLGLKEASGRYIGFMDSDDWVMPDLYERMVALADSTGADCVGTDMCRIYEHSMVPTEHEACNLMSQTGVFDHEKRKAFLLHPGPLGTKIYSREIFFGKEFKFPEKMAYEDNAAFVEIVMRIKHFEHIPETNVFYYQHAGSTTHTINISKCKERMAAARMMLEFARANGALEEFPEELEYQFIILFYKNTLFGYMQSDIKKDWKFVKEIGEEMKATFPNFRANVYYNQNVNAYEQNLINLHMASLWKFMIVFKLKMISRKIRNRKAKA